MVFFSALDAQKELADHKESELSDIPEQNISNSEAEPPLDSLSVEEMCKDFDDSSLVSSDDSTLHAESNEEDDGETSGESYHRFVFIIAGLQVFSTNRSFYIKAFHKTVIHIL